MKIRNGFVSNSSSSSFVIVADCEDATISLQKSIKDISEKILRTEDDVNEWLINEYGYDTIKEIFSEYSDVKKDYNAMLKAIHNGGVVFVGSASSESDDPIEVAMSQGALMEDAVVSNNGKVIRGDGY